MKFLIAGLGNAGDEYAHTRHNIGFDVVNAFVSKHQGQLKTDRLAFTSEIRWKGRIFVCVCPSTYMNLSGKAVKYWMDKEKIEKENMLVGQQSVIAPAGVVNRTLEHTFGRLSQPVLRNFKVGVDHGPPPTRA